MNLLAMELKSMMYGLHCTNSLATAIRRIIMRMFLWSLGYLLLPFIVLVGVYPVGFVYCIITVVIPEFIKAMYEGVKEWRENKKK